MDDLTKLPNTLDKKSRTCRIIIETPKGRRNKFDYDPETQLFSLGGLLPEGLAFPYDFGFVPSTLGDDDDPLDVMIFMEEPAHVGCLVDIRLIGVMEAKQTENGKKTVNNRLIGVAVHSYTHENFHNIAEVNPSILKQVEQFFISYNKGRGKRFEVTGLHGPKRAMELLDAGMKKFKKQTGT